VHIEEYLKKEEEIYIVCGKKQIDFARQYLEKYSEKLIFKVLETDIGLINKENSLEIDKNKLEKKLIEFINSWEEIVVKEIDFLRSKNLEKIITDISPIGMLIGKKLGVKVIAISNFTWYNQYLYLKLDKFILDKFLEVENFINKFIMYPLSLNLSHINCKKEKIGYVAREFNIKKINEIRKKYKEIIFISCGKSVKLEKIEINNYKGTIFYTDGIEIIGEGQHIKLPIETGDTHNYVGASDFIISKAGWGTVAEAMVSKVPMVLLERDGVLEDSYTINELKNQKKAVSIKVEELKKLDIEKLKKKIRNISRGKTRIKE
jgi:hypothetical protein